MLFGNVTAITLMRNGHGSFGIERRHAKQRMLCKRADCDRVAHSSYTRRAHIDEQPIGDHMI